jgi:hypothetical protein
MIELKGCLNAFIVIFILSLFLVGCGNQTSPMPTSTSPPITIPINTATRMPTGTPTSTATETSTPTQTSTPSATYTKTPKLPTATSTEIILLTPAGTPIASWNEISIMPNAISGEEEFSKLGWDLFAFSTNPSGNQLIFYQKGNQLLTLGLLIQGDIVTVKILITSKY